MASPDQKRIKSLLCETIKMLCKNGLHFNCEFRIEALIGITVDQQDVFLISMNELISHNDCFVWNSKKMSADDKAYVPDDNETRNSQLSINRYPSVKHGEPTDLKMNDSDLQHSGGPCSKANHFDSQQNSNTDELLQELRQLGSCFPCGKNNIESSNCNVCEKSSSSVIASCTPQAESELADVSLRTEETACRSLELCSAADHQANVMDYNVNKLNVAGETKAETSLDCSNTRTPSTPDEADKDDSDGEPVVIVKQEPATDHECADRIPLTDQNNLKCDLAAGMLPFDRHRMGSDSSWLYPSVHDQCNSTGSMARYPDSDQQFSCRMSDDFNQSLYQRSRTRPRSSFTREQVHELEMAFAKSQYLSMEMRMSLTQKLHLSDMVIQVWFQNRRQKLKKIMQSYHSGPT